MPGGEQELYVVAEIQKDHSSPFTDGPTLVLS
jgi:hypothetical protein